jgi:hypothetical protein
LFAERQKVEGYFHHHECNLLPIAIAAAATAPLHLSAHCNTIIIMDHPPNDSNKKQQQKKKTATTHFRSIIKQLQKLQHENRTAAQTYTQTKR